MLATTIVISTIYGRRKRVESAKGRRQEGRSFGVVEEVKPKGTSEGRTDALVVTAAGSVDSLQEVQLARPRSVAWVR